MANKNTLRAETFIKYLMVVFSFIASLTSIIGFVYTIISDNYGKNSSLIWILIGFICILGLIGCILLIRSEKAIMIEQTVQYASGIHDILHFIRDRWKELDNLSLRNDKMNEDDYIKKITIDNIEIMDKLSEILSVITKHKIRSCIKLIDFTKNNESNSDKMNIITFARNGKNARGLAEAEHKKRIKVSDNTDFEFIFTIKEVYEEHRIHYFYQKNLKRFSKKNEYKNSDINWKRKYNTTIVMPIRYLKESNQSEAIYDIIGFLCVDSKSAGAFEKNNLYFTVEFLKGIADIMYSYLNSCINYYKMVMNENQTTNLMEEN